MDLSGRRIFLLTSAVFPSSATHTLSLLRFLISLEDAGAQVLLFGKTVNTAAAVDWNGYYGERSPSSTDLVSVSSPGSRGKIVRTLVIAREVLASVRSAYRFGPEIVYTRLVFFRLLFFRKWPIVLEMHGPGPLASGFLLRKIFILVIRTCPDITLVTTSVRMVDYLKANFPMKKVRYAPLASPDPQGVVEVKSERNNQFTVGYVGHVDTSRLRGLDIVVSLAFRMPEIQFVVAGGSCEDAGLREAEVPSNLKFHGRLPSLEAFQLTELLDVVLSPLRFLPSKANPMGNNQSPLKISSYLAQGKSIVASDVPQHRDLLVHERNALLVESDDLISWEMAIRRLQRDKAMKENLQVGARLTYENLLTPARRLELIFGD